MEAQKKKNMKVRDLKPRKDAKGGGSVRGSGTGGMRIMGTGGGGRAPQVARGNG